MLRPSVDSIRLIIRTSAYLTSLLYSQTFGRMLMQAKKHTFSPFYTHTHVSSCRICVLLCLLLLFSPFHSSAKTPSSVPIYTDRIAVCWWCLAQQWPASTDGMEVITNFFSFFIVVIPVLIGFHEPTCATIIEPVFVSFEFVIFFFLANFPFLSIATNEPANICNGYTNMPPFHRSVSRIRLQPITQTA